MAAIPGLRFLGELIAETPGASLMHGDACTPISGISNDTRALQPGDLFVAVPGFESAGLA